ncbi:MAG: hypothetical protein K8S99_17105 [Planctomycetes bacterium]|nr:hypothetical protein [Planctomycetota bacterium]
MDRERDITTTAPGATGASAPGDTATAAVSGQRLEELAQIIRAYNQVTENLQKSHESLNAQIDRLREQLASADAQLLRSKRLAALGEMAAGIAHEVRNPLAAIQLYANMITQDLAQHAARPLTALDSSADAARKITSAVRGLNGIVNDVLTFARDLSPRVAPLTVGVLFDRVLDTQRPVIESAGVRVRRVGSEALTIGVDPDLMHQAAVNVVRNAVEAMIDHLAAPPRPRVLTLDAKSDGRFVMLSIRDTGPGIAAEHIERIFNPFFTTRNTGTGLGLAIVHRIVDAHGGAITVHNDPAGGAVFELSMPLHAAAPDTESSLDEPVVVGTAVASSELSRSRS